MSSLSRQTELVESTPDPLNDPINGFPINPHAFPAWATSCLSTLSLPSRLIRHRHSVCQQWHSLLLRHGVRAFGCNIHQEVHEILLMVYFTLATLVATSATVIVGVGLLLVATVLAIRVVCIAEVDSAQHVHCVVLTIGLYSTEWVNHAFIFHEERGKVPREEHLSKGEL